MEEKVAAESVPSVVRSETAKKGKVHEEELKKKKETEIEEKVAAECIHVVDKIADEQGRERDIKSFEEFGKKRMTEITEENVEKGDVKNCFQRQNLCGMTGCAWPKRRKYIFAIYLLSTCLFLVVTLVIGAHINTGNKTSAILVIIIVSFLMSNIPAVLLIVMIHKANRGTNVTVDDFEDEYKEVSDPEISGDIKMILDGTRVALRSKRNHRFVETKAFYRGYQKLKVCDILIYKGKCGSGKRMAALHLMDRWRHDQGYRPVILRDLRKLDELSKIKLKFLVLVENLIENLEGKQLTSKELDRFKYIVDLVEKRKGKIKIILIFTSPCFGQQYEFWTHVQHVKLFKEDFIIDLSSEEFKLSSSEKEDLLQVHCQMNGIIICSSKKDENYHETDKKKKQSHIQISKDTLDEITAIEPVIGFPQCCAMFPKNIRMGIRFFFQPDNSVLEELHNMKKSNAYLDTTKYKILTSVLCGDQQVFENKEYEYAIQALTGTCIEKDTYGHFKFANTAIEIAVCLSMVKSNPKTVLQHCSWIYIKHFIKSKDQKAIDRDFPILLIEKNMLDLLIDRFMIEFRNSIAECFICIGHLGENFLQSLFKNIEKDTKYVEAIRINCVENGEAFMGACRSGHRELVEKLWKLCKAEITREILEYALRKTGDKKLLNFLEKCLKEKKKTEI